MDREQKDKRFKMRLMFFAVAPALMFAIMVPDQGVGTALTIVLFAFLPGLLVFYAIFAGRLRCPACKSSFALELDEYGAMHRLYRCRYCDHTVRRQGAPSSGGGSGGP